MNNQTLIDQLKLVRDYFQRATSNLEEEHSSFKPTDEMWNTAQVIAHTAQCVDWFFEGAFRPEGFFQDWEAMQKEVAKHQSVDQAQQYLTEAFDRGLKVLKDSSMEDLMAPIVEGEIMGGAPRLAIINGIEDHTAHHRGVLTVYARLLGLVPKVPYMDTE